jgi:hypothetical protein
MYYNHKSPSASTYLAENRDSEIPFSVNQAVPESDYSVHDTLRHEERYRQREIKCKTPSHPDKSKVLSATSGKHFSADLSNAEFLFCNRELLDDSEFDFRVYQAGPESDYSKYQSLRHDKMYIQRQINCKAPPHLDRSRIQCESSERHFSSVYSNPAVLVFNRELLEDPEFHLHLNTFDCINGTVKTVDNINSTALNLAMKNEKPNQKNQNPPRLLDMALQTEKYNHEVNYPIWNTIEIAQPIEGTIPIFKENKVSGETQMENCMFMKHELPHKHQPSEKILIISAKSAQSHKTYVDAVQHEITKLSQGFGQPHPITIIGKEAFLRVKRKRRNKTKKLLQFKDFFSAKIYSGITGTEKQSHLIDANIETNAANTGKRNENRDMFSFEELVECLTETKVSAEMKTGEEVNFGFGLINTENKCTHQETGGDNSALETSNGFDLVGNERPFNEKYSRNISESSYPSCNKENDFYCSFHQVMSHVKAEITAVAGFDLETAFYIAYNLWGRRKQRLPYTRMFIESSFRSSNYEAEAHILPCPQIQDHFPN